MRGYLAVFDQAHRIDRLMVLIGPSIIRNYHYAYLIIFTTHTLQNISRMSTVQFRPICCMTGVQAWEMIGAAGIVSCMEE